MANRSYREIDRSGDSVGFRLARAALRRPRATLILTAAVLALAAGGLLRLELRTDGRALVPPDDPAVVHDDRVRREFGLRDPIAVVVSTDHADGIFNPGTLGTVLELTRALLLLEGVEPEHVVSLATEKGDRVRPGTLEFRPFLEEVPNSPSLLAMVKGDVEAVDVLSGTLVSADRQSTAVLVGVPLATSPSGQDVDRVDLYHRIAATARALVPPLDEGAAGSTPSSDRIAVVGAPVAEALLGEHILEDLARLLPVAVSLMAWVLWLGCRRFWGVLLGLSEVGAVLIFVFGVMGWLGVPVYLTTAVLPVVLVTLGLADEIHVFWRYQSVLERPGVNESEAPSITLAEMVRPVVLTSITTGVGFLSFLFSPLAAVRGFGAFAALGILFCLVFSLTAIPAALSLLGPDRLRRPRRAEGARSSAPGNPGWTISGFRNAYEHPRTVAAVLAIVTLVAGWGAFRIVVQDSWIDGFAPESDFRQATDRVNESFHGTHLLLLDVTLAPPERAIHGVLYGATGPLLLPDRLWKIGQLENFVRDLPGVGGVLGPYSQALTASFLRHGRQEAFRTLPTDAPAMANLLHWFGEARGRHRLREIYHDDRDRGVITVFLENANYRETARLMEEIRAWEAEHLEPVGMAVAFAGDVAVSQAMIPVIVRSQVTSLLVALAGALLAVALLLRSPRAAVLIVAPTALAIVWIFGVMGMFGIPLGVATSMFCAITLGIGVDYSIHFHHAYGHAARRGAELPAVDALRATGPAILIDTLAIALGFGLLMFSQVPANARLGCLVALALTSSCALTLVGLGAGLHQRR